MPGRSKRSSPPTVLPDFFFYLVGALKIGSAIMLIAGHLDRRVGPAGGDHCRGPDGGRFGDARQGERSGHQVAAGVPDAADERQLVRLELI